MTLTVLVFFVAVALAAWILAGWPILLALLSRWRAKPIRKEPVEPTVSVIIPVYNGERFLAEKLRSVLALDYPGDRIRDILVVSDGSTDSTDSIANSFASSGVRLLRVPRGGKPAALNAAIPLTSGEILLLTDVRQTLDPGSVRALMACFADPQVGVVSGELRIHSGSTQAEANIGLYWRFEAWIRDRLSELDSMFGATGPFYAIRRDLAVPVPPDILLDDVYLPISAYFRGYRLVMQKQACAWDYPTTLDTEFQRKVRTLAGNYQILLAYPALLGPGNRMWLHFMSYKFGRLLMPWLLIAIAVSSALLPGPWNVLALAPQVALYGLAALDGLLAGSPLRRLSSVAKTFVVMMIATVRGLAVFFVPARTLWKVTAASK